MPWRTGKLTPRRVPGTLPRALKEQGGPPPATGTDLAEARRLADDAVHGIRLALREVDFVDGRLAHVLLAHELSQSVNRSFGTVSCGHPHEASFGPAGPGFGPEPPRLQPRGFLAGCAAFAGLCCTCRMCCADAYEGPWSRKKREGCCSDCDCGNCDCDCCNGCDCGNCDCCDCCSCCDC
jgi:hypothetical protein